MRRRGIIAAWIAATLLAVTGLPARADLYDDMRARFLVYPAICNGRVECVLARMQSWFGRPFEAHTTSGVIGIYLVRRDADGRLTEFHLVGEI